MDQEQAKTKKKRPNLFDVIFIVLILVVAVGAYFLVHGTGGEETTLRTYVIELTGLREGMESSVAVGDTVTDTVKNYGMGTVTATEVVPYEETTIDAENGVYRQIDVAGYVTLRLTVEAETTETEKEITTAGGYAIRTGTAVNCSVGTLVSSGYILEVQR